MEIVNITEAKRPLKVRDLSIGDVYRQESGCEETLVVITYGSGTRASLSLNTSEIVYWNGHQNQRCFRLKAKLEVSEEV